MFDLKCTLIRYIFINLICVRLQDDDMSKGGNLLERSMKRLGAMSRSLHNYHTPILFAFVFFVFLLLWLALKFR